MPNGESSRADILILYWGRHGGGSAFSLWLYQHIREFLPDMQPWVSLRADNPELGRFQDAGAPVSLFRPHAAGGGLHPLQLLRSYAAQWRFIRHCGFRDIIVTMNSPFCIPFIPWLARSGARIVYVAHDAEPHPGAPFARLQRLAQSALLRIAGETVALSGFVAEQLERQGVKPPRRMPLATLAPGIARCPKPPDGPLRLLFAGRMVAYKGLDLLHAALLPLRGDPRWTLTLAGDGPMAAQVHRLFADWPQVDRQIRWFGDLEFEALFARHDLLLCPYREASQSGVVAQALAAGMPVLVTPHGALPEQIGLGSDAVAGLVAADATPASFRSLVEATLDDPARLAAMGRAAEALMATCRTDTGWLRLLDPAATARRATAGSSPPSSSPS